MAPEISARLPSLGRPATCHVSATPMKTVLLTVSGMSPAILTETLWALSREAEPVVPDEVVVITTLKGEEDLRRQLLEAREDWDGQSVWETLRQDLLSRKGVPGAGAGLQLSIRVIDCADPEAGVRTKAEDLRTRTDNAEAANFILQTVSPFVEAADVRVVASLAGGRKTMGALLYAAMSLVGRDTDRVTHVLVSEPYEQCRGFFFPDQPIQELKPFAAGEQRPPVRAEEARIDLADVPFVPLRNGFAELGEPRRSFAGLVEHYSRAIRSLAGPPRASFEENRQKLVLNGRPVNLSGREFLLAWFLFDRARQGAAPLVNREEAAQAWRSWYGRTKESHPEVLAKSRLDERLSEDDVTKALSGLRQRLRECGLENLIPFLAPVRDRIGFEVKLG